MTELIIFAVAALGAVWSRGRLDQASTSLAVLIAYFGLQGQGWIGFAWSWEQAGWYSLLAVVMAVVLFLSNRDDFWYRGGKPWVDYAALGIWGVVQQGVLLGWLAQVSPVLSVLIFAALHIPNKLLFIVTLVGGAASVCIASQFGTPSILVAGLFHAATSWFLRDWLGAEMAVGRSYDGRFELDR